MGDVRDQSRNRLDEGLLPRAVDIEPPRELWLPPRVVDPMLAHLRAALPNEGCGLVASARRDGAAPGDAEWAVRFYPGTNIDASRVRYTMDPGEVLAAFRDMEGHGWRLGAIVHSHPRTAAEPSATDLRESYYPGALTVIVSFATPEPVVRGWRLVSGQGGATSRFQETVIVVADEA